MNTVVMLYFGKSINNRLDLSLNDVPLFDLSPLFRVGNKGGIVRQPVKELSKNFSKGINIL
jgi:hypothetical protein